VYIAKGHKGHKDIHIYIDDTNLPCNDILRTLYGQGQVSYRVLCHKYIK
jgi:hypothetical protein